MNKVSLKTLKKKQIASIVLKQQEKIKDLVEFKDQCVIDKMFMKEELISVNNKLEKPIWKKKGTYVQALIYLIIIIISIVNRYDDNFIKAGINMLMLMNGG